MCSFFLFLIVLCYNINIVESWDIVAELIELKKDEYENFLQNNKKSHFLQSYYWGEFSKEKKNLTPYYMGLVDENRNILGTCLLLQKKLPLNYSYFYCPRGFVLDYTNSDLISNMTKKVIEFIKTKKAIFLKIDPDIIRKKYNYLNEEVELSTNPDIIFDNLIKCGYKHLGFTKNFETMQPRYTFRIDMNQSIDDIYNHFSKTTKQRIQKAIKLGTEVCIGTSEDIDTFYKLMTITETRKDFVSYSKDYYQKQYEILSKNNMAKLFLGKLNLDKIITNLKNESNIIEDKINSIDKTATSKSTKNKLKELESNYEKIKKEIIKYEEAKAKYGDIITLNAHMIITYHDKAWVLYAGNHNILTESYANYNTYYEHIKYAYENGIKIYDQFGTIGDLNPNNPRLGLHEFKKKFGGDYVEFLGEFDYITNHFMYFVFTKLVPLYRNLVKRRSKKEISNEVKRDK